MLEGHVLSAGGVLQDAVKHTMHEAHQETVTVVADLQAG